MFSTSEMILFSSFVLMLGGYRIFQEATNKGAAGSVWIAAGYFLIAALNFFEGFLDFRKGRISPTDLIPGILIAAVFLILGLLEVRHIRKNKKS